MRRITLLLLIVSVLFSSCSTAFRFTTLQPSGELSTKLPSLDPVTYISSLENAYSKGQSSSVGSAFSTGGLGGAITVGSALTTHYADKRVNDALILFERDVKDNITHYIGDRKGAISFKITNSSYNLKSNIISFSGASIGTYLLLAIPTLLKMESNNTSGGVQAATTLGFGIATPLVFAAIFKRTATQVIEIEVEIFNLQDKVVGRYTALGVGTYKSNFYTFPTDAQRVVNAEAVKNAMQEVKNKIEKDKERLNAELM